MDKRIVKIEEIKDNEVFVDIFLEEIKKIQEIPKMPKCEFLHQMLLFHVNSQLQQECLQFSLPIPV